MLKGYFDIATNYLLHGWAYDESLHDLVLEIYVNDAHLGDVVANKDYPALKASFGIVAKCGFVVKLQPHWFRGGLNVIKVVSRHHKAYINYMRSPSMNHLPFVVGDEDFLQLNSLAKLHDGVLRILEKRPELMSTLTPYLEDKIALAPKKLDILIVNGLPDGMSAHYRVNVVTEWLDRTGYSVFSITEPTAQQALVHFNELGTIVFFRCPFNRDIERLIVEFKARGTKIIFDIDDLVFDPSILLHIDGYRRLPAEDRSSYLGGVQGYRRLAAAADVTTVTTHYLASAMQEVCPDVHVVPNMLSKKALAITSDVYAKRLKRQEESFDKVVIGYYSGTATHQADFAEIVVALRRVLTEHPAARLRIVGKLDISEFSELSGLGAQIDRVGLMSYDEMLRDFVHVDIILAPLESDNPFCESKSELKYFEAAAAGIVAVVTSTDTFRRATDGKFAVLCNSIDDWLIGLRKLIRNPQLRAKMGEAARGSVLTRYNAGRIELNPSEIYRKVSELAGINRGKQSLATRQKISIVVPGVFSGSGGLRKIFTFAKYLAEDKNFLIEVISTGHPSAFDLEAKVVDNYGRIHGAQYSVTTVDLSQASLVICTHWTTAHLCWDAATPAEKVMYFIQDYEPYFEPAGTNFVRAADTYTMKYRHIYFGPWVGSLVKTMHEVSGVNIPFPIDRDVYYPEAKSRVNNGKKLIIAYAKPSQPRRAFELMCEALNNLSTLSENFKVIFYGDHFESPGFKFDHEILGSVNEPSMLADLYRSGDIGLSFSTTNPSLVGYEMMACGLPIVDLLIPYAANNYGDSKAAVMSKPNAGNISKEILQLISDDSSLKRLRNIAARDVIEYCSSEAEFGAAMVDEVAFALKELAAKNQALAIIAPNKRSEVAQSARISRAKIKRESLPSLNVVTDLSNSKTSRSGQSSAVVRKVQKSVADMSAAKKMPSNLKKKRLSTDRQVIDVLESDSAALQAEKKVVPNRRRVTDLEKSL